MECIIEWCRWSGSGGGGALTKHTAGQLGCSCYRESNLSASAWGAHVAVPFQLAITPKFELIYVEHACAGMTIEAGSSPSFCLNVRLAKPAKPVRTPHAP